MLTCLAALALALTLSFTGCGDDGGEGGTTEPEVCEVNAGECPNLCEHGIGVEGETCGGTTDCECGLFCKGSACAPYEGSNEGCSCTALSTDSDTAGGGGGAGDAGGGDDPTPDTSGGGGDGPVDDCPQNAPANWICNPYCQTGCPEGQACTFSGGAGACAPAGLADMGEVCAGTSCLPGHACVQFTGDPASTCRRFCVTDADCGEDRKCNLTVNGMFTVCSEPTVGCDLFGDAETACEAGQGCYYNNQTSQCMAAGTKQGGDAVEGTCVGGSVTCAVDAQCTACDGYVADADAQSGLCLGTDKICNSHDECQQCEGYVASAPEDMPGVCSNDGVTSCVADGECAVTCEGYVPGTNETMGTCDDGGDTPCATDDACAEGVTCVGFEAAVPETGGACAGSDAAVQCFGDAECSGACEGFMAAGSEVMGVCSDGMELANSCTTNDDCTQMCEGLIASSNETAGTCAYDGVTECTAAQPCVSSCDGAVAGGQGEICGVANDCVAGLQCLVVCTDICSLDGSAGIPCSGCPIEFMEINADNNMGICITENAPAACDLYNPSASGCAAGEACYSLRGGHGCLGAGVQIEGTECKFSNDCTGGNLCINSMCLEACDQMAAEGAPESCGVKCDGSEPGSLTPAIWGVGFCKDAPPAEPCSFWEQNCTGGKVCYGTVLGEACMTPDGTAGEGDGCTRNQDCAPGLVCPSSNSPNSGQCTRPCSIVIPDFDGSMSDCGSTSDCGLPESCIGGKCAVPYCADDCPGAAAEPVATDSQIGTCSL
jgi:hypothetical protein